ncbi:glycerol kinase GlpK [Herbiconiux sp. CPCC 203407]|uniref:Glycerol kinase n=1 Tax=Herbiconiux oxytropis TaxID=2970915 RepID=A0AA41XK07_9MICO|nr:glycerol kinase GlpK [Herbiconiux oxytropis]MCS5723661.1 glycerol kinase GlpK [Herbiconiux oxytropis]MCS5728070.1 glycerol kinase GlpK [Herbiconiux oxytropis]
MTKTHVMALDAGTGSVRAILFRHDGSVEHIAQEEFEQHYPTPGWVEHDAMDIWESQSRVAHRVLAEAGVEASAIAAIGITNQRETCVLWDRTTGEPLHNALVWQDGRTAGLCDELRAAGHAGLVRHATGLPIDTYFSGTKIKWLLDNVAGARERAERGELLAGTIDSWLIWKLTDGAAHVTDYSNASRTMCFNIRDLRWDDDILALLDIPRGVLPEVRPSSEVYGWTGRAAGFGAAIPVASAAGDQQGALFGQACFTAGSVKATYGTGGSVMMNTGTTLVESEAGLITTIAWGLDGRVDYALEGVFFGVGATIKWLRDELRVIDDVADTAAIASSVPDTGGVYLVPAFTGLASPYWDQYARASMFGITPGTGRAQLVRAAIESMSYSYRDVIDAMTAESGTPLPELRVDGGAVANDFHLQFQADQLGVPVRRPRITESTARGAAFLAGLAVGFWDSQEELRDTIDIERSFLPQMDDATRERLYAGWTKAVSRTLDWVEH